MYEHYHTSYISDIDEEQIDYAETGNIGMMDEDKICRFFMAMGAKCYAYIDVKNRPQVTVAGLNASNYKKWMESQMKEGEPVQGMLLKWFRPNTFITPEGTKKLLVVKDGEGFDKEGLWKGPVLHPVGFQLVNTASHFHCHNMRMAAFLQDLPEDYYIGKYTSSSALFVTDTGIYNASEYEEYKNRDDLYTDLTAVLEDQQPIKGGMIDYALSLQPV